MERSENMQLCEYKNADLVTSEKANKEGVKSAEIRGTTDIVHPVPGLLGNGLQGKTLLTGNSMM